MRAFAWHYLTWGPQRTTHDSALSFHHVGPENGTMALNFDGRCLYPLSKLSSPKPHFLNTNFTYQIYKKNAQLLYVQYS